MKNTMRLFVAMALPDSILTTLDALASTLRPLASLDWSPSANLHITTKFIGEWPEERLEELKSSLAALPRPGVIPIHLEGVGWFPNPHSPRVFRAAVRSVPALGELANATGQAAVALGAPAETAAFRPHVTLARIRKSTDLAPLLQAIARLDSVDFGAFEAKSFSLYLSQPKPGGSFYKKLGEFPLS